MMVQLCIALAAVFLTAKAALATCPNATAGRVDIYPTADVLPANLLRMYVYYPRPMAADEGLKNVRLIDETGKDLEDVFLNNRAELWSPNRQRLTLLLDPGRVKTGLVANAAFGRALVPGQSYTLAISGTATDTFGCALKTETTYNFTVGGEDTEAPNPASWVVRAPAANSSDHITVDLGSTHDHLSLAYRLRILDYDGVTVPGAIALGPGETSWVFTPSDPWKDTKYTLTIDYRLEDLAGNRPGALFDRPSNKESDASIHVLDFVPKPPKQQ